MSVLTKLLDFLPTCFNTEPEQVSVFSIRHDDPLAKLEYTLEDNVLSCRVFSSFSNDFEIDLEDLTIKEVVEKINTAHHYSASLQYWGDKSALRLVDVKSSTDNLVYAFTSPTWAVFKALGMELKEAQNMGDEALKQMSAQGSTGYLTDYWCDFLNNSRKVDEPDMKFAVRTINEVGLPKSNNVALEEILENYYGFHIEVIDLVFEQTAVFTMNNVATPVHNPYFPLTEAGSIYKEPGTFALIFPDNTISGWKTPQIDELREVVHADKASGTRCKVFWSDPPPDPWMLMNNTPTPVHNKNFILPFTKNSEFFSFYL